MDGNFSLGEEESSIAFDEVTFFFCDIPPPHPAECNSNSNFKCKETEVQSFNINLENISSYPFK